MSLAVLSCLLSIPMLGSEWPVLQGDVGELIDGGQLHSASEKFFVIIILLKHSHLMQS